MIPNITSDLDLIPIYCMNVSFSLQYGWSYLYCWLFLEIESFYLCTDQQTSHPDGDSGKHDDSDRRAFQRFFFIPTNRLLLQLFLICLFTAQGETSTWSQFQRISFAIFEGTKFVMQNKKIWEFVGWKKIYWAKREEKVGRVKMGWVNEFNACIDLISCRHWHDSVRGSRSVRRPGEQPRIPTKKRTSESLCFFLGIPQPAGFTRTWCSCTTLDFPILYLVPSSDVFIFVITIAEMVSRECLVFKRLNAWAMSIRPWSTNCEFARYEEHHFLHTWQWERAFPEENISWWAVDAHGSYIFAESSYRVSNKQTKYMKVLNKRKFPVKHILILSCAEANYSFFWLSFVAICWCMDWLALWFICSLYKPT